MLLATDLPTFDAIETIEQRTDRPLLSCNQTILWAALDRRDVRIEGKGLGRLFQHQPARQELVR